MKRLMFAVGLVVGIVLGSYAQSWHTASRYICGINPANGLKLCGEKPTEIHP